MTSSGWLSNLRHFRSGFLHSRRSRSA
jgi:hypothetical protein